MVHANKHTKAEDSELTTPRRGILDISLLVGSALLLAAMGFGSFLLAFDYDIPPAWIFAIWLGILFMGVVGVSLRSKLSNPLFIVFLLGRAAVHIVLVLWVLKNLNLFYVYPFIILELWVGYTLVSWLFGLPPDNHEKSATHYKRAPLSE
jgi:hypothetical protein